MDRKNRGYAMPVGGRPSRRPVPCLAAAAIGFLMGSAATVFVWLLCVMA